MRWRAFLAGRKPDPVEPGQLGAGRARERPERATVVVALDVVDVHDARRPRADLRHLRFPRRGLPLPRMVAATRPRPRSRRARTRPRAEGAPPRSGQRVPNASTSSPSSPARRVWSSRTRWTMQSPGPTSNAPVRSRQTPEPPRTKKISSSAVCRWRGVDHLPGSTLTRFRPDRLRPGRHAEIGPLAGDVAGFARGRAPPRPSGRSHADYVPCQRRA